MKFQSKAVHAGDRKNPGSQIPVTTPIYTATSYFYDDIETVDKVFAHEIPGFAYSRYHNPTNEALEEQITALEGGAGTLATASGMAGIQIAVQSALTDRRKCILASNALYGASISLLHMVLEPFGIDINYVDISNTEATLQKIEKLQPGCVLMESISNPLLRVGEIDKIAEATKKVGGSLIVDNTFATPLLLRPLELGANIVVHSGTKFMSGHGDMLGGFVTCDTEHLDPVRTLSRVYGPVLGPFSAYLAMRGIKTFPLRMERQCQNAATVFEALKNHPRIGKVYYTGDPAHPDAAVINRLIPGELKGAMLSFEVKDAGREEIFAFLNRLEMIVAATSLGDVHTMTLYPAMSSHREVSPKQRERMGITDSLVRLSVGIEAVEDILDDLNQALQ